MLINYGLLIHNMINLFLSLFNHLKTHKILTRMFLKSNKTMFVLTKKILSSYKSSLSGSPTSGLHLCSIMNKRT